MKRIINKILKFKIFNKLNDKLFLKMEYFFRIGKRLNLKKPQSFNEKLQWLKLYDRNPYYTDLADKCAVRKIVAKEIGESYLIPIIGIYKSFDEIDFDILPDKFVIKCSHDSGGVFICKDKAKLDIIDLKNKVNRLLKVNYYYVHREWVYKNIPPMIIIEKYMTDNVNSQLFDYKIMCFNGKAKCSFVCTERDNKELGLAVTFFDINWNRMPFKRHYRVSDKKIAKPKNYDLMIKLSETLAKRIPFVRVDWYEINGKLYFGELIFYLGSGLEEFEPVEWDYKLGKMIKLPTKSDLNE